MSPLAKIKNNPKLSLLVIIGVVFSAIGIINSQPREVSYAETNICSGSSATMYSNGSTTGVITGLAKINVGVSTSLPAPEKVIVLLDGNPVGQARPESGTSYSWLMYLPTKLLDPKEYELKAIIKQQNYECITSPVITSPVDPVEPNSFDLAPNTSTVELPVNNSTIVSAAVRVNGFSDNFARFALFDWFAENRGSIVQTQNRSTTFYSGPSTGQGQIKIFTRYGFRSEDLFIPTNITTTSSPIADETNTTSGDDSITSTNNTSNVDDSIEDEDVTVENSNQTNTTNNIETSTSEATKECASSALGVERFNEINSGDKRPTLEELNRLKVCFARTNYILPSNFAPVAPGDVSRLQKTTIAKLEQPKSSTKNEDGQIKQTIRLSGKAKPRSIVFVYIFSEPMVLTTTANDNGEWIYELENPLEPGDHTMYAVVDRGDGVFERTDPIDFVIGSAEATADNPAGLSLAIDEQATASESILSTYIFIFSAGLVLAAILIVAIIAYRHGKMAKESDSKLYATINTDDPIPGTASQSIPTQQNPMPANVIKPQDVDTKHQTPIAPTENKDEEKS